MSIATTIEALRRWLSPGPSAGRSPTVRWDVGHDPGVVLVRAGGPIRIVFHRTGTNPGSAEVCFPDFGLLALLPPSADTVVDVGRRDPGRYRFYAPDGDLEGWLVVER
jgi:plastocyanin domain-containing protein